MEEDRQKKIEAGREKFVAYQRRKQSSHHTVKAKRPLLDVDKMDNYMLDTKPHLLSSGDTEDEEKATAANIPVLQASLSQMELLKKEIKKLQESVIDKDHQIESLQIELETARDMAHLDVSTSSVLLSPRQKDVFQEKISELQDEVMVRNNYIKDLSESLQQRSVAYEIAVVKEQQKSDEVRVLREQLQDAALLLEGKVSPTCTESLKQIMKLQSEVVELKNCAEEKMILVTDLRQALERKENEYQQKINQLNKDKTGTIKEIHILLDEVEKLKRRACNKEHELVKAKEQIAFLQAEREKKFVHMKEELLKNHEEEKERLSRINNEVVHKVLKKYESALNDCNNIATQLQSCKLSHEAQVTAYNECMESLLLRVQEENRQAEAEYCKQMTKCNNELQLCQQQIDNFENKLCEEVRKVEEKCIKEIESYQIIYEAELEKLNFNNDMLSGDAQIEIQRLHKELGDMITADAKKNIELETCKRELQRSKEEVSKLKKKVNEFVSTKNNSFDNNINIQAYEEISILKKKLHESQIKEESLLSELSNSKGKIKEYEERVNAFQSNFQQDLDHMEDKQKSVVKAFEEEIQTLTARLEESKSLNHQELHEPYDELQKYKDELSALREKHSKDVILYQNQVRSLKDKIEKYSQLEDDLTSQLVTYAKNLKELQNKIKLILNKSVKIDNKPTGNISPVHDVDALKSELNISQTELYEYVEILGCRFNEIEEQLKNMNVPVCDSSTQCVISSKDKCAQCWISGEDKYVQCLVTRDHKYVQCLVSTEHKYVQCTDEESEHENIKSDELIGKQDVSYEKTNIDLVNKYAELSAMYADLESRKDKLNEENKQVKYDMDKVVTEKKELIAERNLLLEYLDSLKRDTVETNSSSSSENVESRTDVQNNKIKFIFKNAVTSTPNTASEDNMKANYVRVETPKRQQDELRNIDAHGITIKLMKQCNVLEEENDILTKNIEVLKTNVKEMEHYVTVAHKEITDFENKCKILESKITELESLENKIKSLEEQNINAQLRIGQLEKERELLRLDVKVTSEESLLAEKKNNSNVTKLYEKFCSSNANTDIELLVLELKQKSDDVVILKEKLYANQEVITALKDKLDEMFVSLTEVISKFDVTRNELKSTRQELEDLRKERGEISLAKRLLEKESVLLKIKIKELENRRERTNPNSYSEDMIKMIEEMQNEIVNLTKQTLNDRQLIENLKIENSLARDVGGAGEMSITQRIEILIKSKGEEMEEKTKLIMCLEKLQELLSAYESGQEVREDLLEKLRDLQDNLISELQMTRQQDEKMIEIFAGNNRLHDMLSTLQDQIVVTLKEKTQMEESFQENEVSLKTALLKLSHLENQLAQNKRVIKEMKEERLVLEEKLSATEELLKSAEEELEKQKLSMEVQVRDREVRLKQGQLDLIAVQCEQARQNSEPPTVRSVHCGDIRTELMQQHAAGLAKIQRHYGAQYTQALQELNEEKQILQQQHQDQVMKLQNELSTKTKELEELVKLKLYDELSLPEYLNNIQFHDLVVAKEKSKADIEEVKRGLDEKGIKLFYILRDKFQQYAQQQIMFSIAKLKNEHEKELESEMSALKVQYDLHLQKVQSDYEVTKQNEVSLKLQELEKLYCEELTALSEVVDMYNRKLELSQCSESGIALKQLIQCLANDYKHTLTQLNEAWKGKYRETLDEITEELNQNFGIGKSSSSLLDTNLTDSEKLGSIEILMEQQEKIIRCAQDLYVKLEEQHLSAMRRFQLSLELCHEKVVNVVEVLKEQLEDGCVIASLQNEIHNLKIEKREFQEQHKSALDLLHKDHEVELNKFQDLLSELQQLSKEGGDAKAMYILRTELETKHAHEMEELRTYFEKKCTDLEKNYSEEIYSQHSRKVSGSSSGSDSEAIADMYYSGGGDMTRRISCQQSDIEAHLHEKCERRLAEVREELSQLSEEMEIKYRKEVEAVELKYAIIFQDYVQENMTTNQNAELQELERRHTESLDSFYEKARKEMEKEVNRVQMEWESKLELAKRDFEKQKESGIKAVQKELQEKYCRKIEELEKKFLAVKDSQDMDILVAQIEAVVRAEFDSKLEKSKQEIEEKCIQERDEDIENLNKLHEERIEKMKGDIEKTEIQRRKDEIEKVRRKMCEAHNEELMKLKERLHQQKEEELEKIIQLHSGYGKGINTDEKESHLTHEEVENVNGPIANTDNERQDKAIENIKKEMLDMYNEELKNAIEEIEKREIDSREKEVDKIKRELLEAYQREVEKAREEIETREINKREDKINKIVSAHSQELLKQKMKYEDIMKMEITKAVLKERSEAHYQLELEEKVKMIKEEVRSDYERELERLREEIEGIEYQRREEEIKLLREALNDAYEREVTNIKQECESELKRKIENIKNETNLELKQLVNAHREEVMKLRDELEKKVVKERESIIEEENKAASLRLKQMQEGYIEEMKILLDETEQLNTKAAEEIDRLNVRISELEMAHKKEVAVLQDEWEKKLDKEREFIAKEENKMAFLKIGQLEEAYSDEINKLNEDWQRKLLEYEEDRVSKEKEATEMLNMQIRDLENLHKQEMMKVEEEWEQKLLKERECIAKEENKIAYLKIHQMEEDYKNMFEKINEDWQKRLEEEREFFIKEKEQIEKTKEELLQKQVENARSEVLHTLEFKIKALVASCDDDSDKSDWPPELATLESQFAAKYQRQLAQIVQERAIEIAELHAEYEAKIDTLVKDYSAKPEEMAPSIESVFTGDDEFDKVIRERDCLKQMTCTLRQVVNELAKYLITCEDELNNTLIGELMKQSVDGVTNPQEHNNLVRICELTDNSESDEERNKSSLEDKSLILTPKQPKRVHFAPDVSNIINMLDEDSLLDFIEKNQDVSVDFRIELESCLERLKLEAAALLGLSTLKVNSVSTVEGRRLASVTRQLIDEKKAKEELNKQFKDLQELNMKYEQEIRDLQNELTETIERFAKVKTAAAGPTNVEVETVYGGSPIQARIHKFTELQDRARTMITEKGDGAQPWLGILEELAREAEDAFRDRDDLQQQIAAADKQLRSTRAFLEEQATEREQERDEFNKELSRLQEQLRDRDKEWTTKERFATEWLEANRNRMGTMISTRGKTVEALEQQVRETTELLKETERRKDSVEKELKAAIDKVWMLREIISDLEVQVSNKSEREASLEQRLDELETELDKQNRAQENMVQELEALRQAGGDQALLEQVRTLQEQLKKQTNSSAVRQMKSQLREMTKSVEKRTKDLEAVNIHTSATSLSSPSEDVSIREQLESLRCNTPEDKFFYNGSPPLPLPIEEVSRLHDKLVRHSRAEETVVKKIRDQHMQMGTLRSHLEDVQSERDVLQEQCDRQLVQLASTQSKLEELRRRFDKEQAAATAHLQERIKELESQRGSLIEKLTSSDEQIVNLRKHLDQAERVVANHESLLSSRAESQHELIDRLKQDLGVMEAEKNKLEAMVSKYRSEQNISLPALVEIMLADKNADIDQLQHRVTQLEAQCSQTELESSESRVGHTNSKGHRVSFATDLTTSHSQLQEGEKLRDAIHENSIEPVINSSHIFEMGKPVVADFRSTMSELKLVPEPEPIADIRQDRAEQLDMVLLHLKSELEEKSKRLRECEEQLAELPAMEKELCETKEELLATVAAVTEDKRFYEEQLERLANTQQLLTEREAEIENLRDTLVHKEEFIIKLNADVQALEMILENLQKSIQSANKYAEIEEQNAATLAELEKTKQVNSKLNEDYLNLKKDNDNSQNEITKLQRSLSAERNKREILKKNLLKSEKDKDNMSNELNKVKAKCIDIEKELNDALKKKNEIEHKLITLTDELSESRNLNVDLDKQCQNLREELQEVSKKHSMDLKNYIKKDSEEVAKLKRELEELKHDNRELQADCEKLRQELEVAEENMALSTKLLQSEDKIGKLEHELKNLEETKQSLEYEKNKVEENLGLEIAVLKTLIDDLQKNVDTLEKSEKISQNNIVRQRETQNVVVRKYELLKRECEKQRRAKKEVEKKCQVLKEELEKEKKYVALLEKEKNDLRELANKKITDKLKITEMDVFEIKPTDQKFRGSIDQLAVEVQKELQVSAQLDSSIISGYGEFDERPFLLSMPVGSPPAAPCPSPVGSPPRFQVPLRLTSPRFDECSYVLATPVGSPPAAPCPSPVGSPPRFQVPQRLTSPRSLASLGPGLCPSPGDSPPRYQIPSRFTSPRTPFGSSPPGPCPSPVGSPPRFQIPSSLTSPRSPRTPCPSPAGSPLAAPTSAARYASFIPCPGLERRAPSPTRATMEQVRAMLRDIHPRQIPHQPCPSPVRPAVEEVDVDDMPESAWDMINRLEARRTDLCDGVERGPSPPICPPISDYAMLDPIPTLEQVTRWLRKLRARGPIMPPPGYPHLQPLIIPSSPQPGSSRMWTPPRRVLTADEVRQRLNLTTPEGGYGQGPCPTRAPRRSPREFLSPRRVQSMFEKSRVGDHFMPISHSTLDLSGYLPAAYSAYETRESGGESPIFKPGQAMTRTMVIPRAAPCPGPSAGGQTFDVRPTGQTFNVPPRVLGQTFTAPPRILEQTYAAPPRVLDRTYSAPPRILDQTYAAPPRVLDRTYTALPHILDQTYAAPPRVLDRTYTALPHILDQTYAAPPRVLDRTYTAPPHVLDRAFSVPPGAGQQVRRPRRYSRDYSFYDPALEEVERRLNLTNICPTPDPSPQQPCPSPAGSPREFMSPRRVQSMFEISRVGDHFMPVAHSSLDLCREYLPLAYSPTTFRASGGLSPVFRPGQAMTRTVIIPHPRYINPRDYYPDETSVAAAGGQTFDIGPRRGPGGQTFNVAAVGAPVLGQTYACPGPSAPAPSGLRQTFDIGPRRGPGGQTFNVAAVGAPAVGQTYACPGPSAPAPSGLDQTFTIACTPPPVPRPVRTRQLYALVTPRVTRSLPRRLGQPLNVTYVVPSVSHSGATPQFGAPDMDTTPLTHRAYDEPFTGADRHVRRRGRLIPIQPQVPLPSQRIVDALQQRLAAAETSLHVERMTIDELRRRIIQDRKRTHEDQEVIANLKLEIQNLHTLNDVLEAKYNRVIEGITKSVSSIKERQQQSPATSLRNEKLFEEIQEESKKLESLVKEKQDLENQVTALRQQVTDLRVQKAILEEHQPALDQGKVDEVNLQLQRQTEIANSLQAKIRMLENAELSRQKRRRAAEQQSKTEISNLKAEKQALEKENMALRLKLRHAQSHLNVIASESPLALKLNEANAELERLVAEKEDLAAAFSDLKEEVKELSFSLNEQRQKNEDLKERLIRPNIIVTDGRLDNLNAKLATERAAWAREKQDLQQALAHSAQAQSGSSLNGVGSDLQHLLGRYLRAESYRKALTWQKRYLMLALVGYQQEELATVTSLKIFSNPFVPIKQGTKLKNKFKVTSLTVVSIVRMKNLVQRRQKVYESTCSLLYQAIIDAKRKSPRRSPAGVAQSAFTRPVRQGVQPLRPGTLAEYIEQFSQLQNRIAVLSQHTVSMAN